ncbi:MAG: putative bifunctional diguanylate cyclase/phosphodiesterase [Nevskiales bacterium]
MRFRLLGLSLGLLAIFGSSSLLLGYLIQRNQSEQQTQQEQYRRFEIIDAIQQAMAQYRHTGGELNSAIMQKKSDLEQQARHAWEDARKDVDVQLVRMGSFDPAGAQIIESALQGTPQYSERVMEAVAAGKQDEAAPLLAELYRRFNLIEESLRSASLRERSLAERSLVEARERAALAIHVAVAMILFGGFAGTLLVLIVVRSIITPLRVTTNAIRQVNAGELEIDLPPISGDEFGQMALALRQFRDGAEKLRRLAYLDTLTGLANRARLREALQTALEQRAGAPVRQVLFYFDLDNFRSVNDRFGHKAGDAYLCEAVARLQRFLPADAELYRYGGDKFIAVLEDPATAAAPDQRLREIADCVLRGVGEPYRLGNHLLHMSVSIGIAASPGDGITAEHLISSAEAAGHAAKSSGRNNARFARGQLTGLLRRQLLLVEGIRRGLEQGEFEVYYQPIVDVPGRRVIGAEALIRWHHPERGLLLPGEFIQLAEDEGLIGELGEHCLRVAHAQLRRWCGQGLPFRLSVNLSARQLQDGKVLQLLSELRGEDAVAAALIDLELTESVLFDSSEPIRKMLEEIRRLGYRLGMDDFGTGYSSFAYLRRLPIDKIKIDRQFVIDLGTSRQSEAIVSAMLALAQKLDLEVVAEGVETPGQMRLLLGHGCRLQQGFLYSVALPWAEFEQWAAAYMHDGATAAG